MLDRMYTGHATNPTIIMEASVYFSSGVIVLVAGPTITDAFRFNTTPVVVGSVDKRDTHGLSMMDFKLSK